MEQATPAHTILTVAGTDPSGAAGIQVDVQVFRDYGFHGLSVITAILSQNTSRVRRIDPVTPELVRDQLAAIFEDLPVEAVKIGLVGSQANARAIGEFLAEKKTDAPLPVVLDTVLASGSGETSLADEATRDAIVEWLFPLADVLTPNVPEAEALLGRALKTTADLENAARDLCGRGPKSVLLKAGHFAGHLTGDSESITDIWAESGVVGTLQPLPRIEEDVRGTGCQLSSAIACGLAEGQPPMEAAEQARLYLSRHLKQNRRRIGEGRSIIVRTGDTRVIE